MTASPRTDQRIELLASLLRRFGPMNVDRMAALVRSMRDDELPRDTWLAVLALLSTASPSETVQTALRVGYRRGDFDRRRDGAAWVYSVKETAA